MTNIRYDVLMKNVTISSERVSPVCCCTATLQELKAAVGTGGILPSQQNLFYHICISLCLWHYIKPSKQQNFVEN